jgi:hypothetical protein
MYVRFLDLDHKPRLVVDYLPQTTANELQHLIDTKNGKEPASKRPKLTGRNKKRPFEKRCLPSEKLCPNVARNKTCLYGERCKFSHDVAKFYKPQETGTDTRCHVFETYGQCSFGITCVFAAHHTDEALNSIVNQELVDKFNGRTFISNILTKDLQIRLRKREYDFSRANRVLKQVEQDIKSAKGHPSAQKTDNEVSQSAAGTPHSSKEGAVTSEQECSGSDSLLSVQTANETVDDTRETIDADGGLNVVKDTNATLAPVNSIVGSAATEEIDHISVSEMGKSEAIAAEVKTSGCVTDEDVISLREEEKKKVSKHY